MERPVLNPGPDRPGAYALILRLARDTRIDIRTLGRPVLPAGLYLYAGSARGPGGIRARVGRHLRQPKAAVWHIDRLTEAARVEAVIAFPGGRECAIADFALAHGARVPVPRFGASDCRNCEAHLLAVDAAVPGALGKIAWRPASLPSFRHPGLDPGIHGWGGKRRVGPRRGLTPTHRCTPCRRARESG